MLWLAPSTGRAVALFAILGCVFTVCFELRAMAQASAARLETELAMGSTLTRDRALDVVIDN